uniref:Uncharacterized protein n=1 Tax=Arundo donax TaxID=35708 RepID=A0A0A9H187_ARUDO
MRAQELQIFEVETRQWYQINNNVSLLRLRSKAILAEATLLVTIFMVLPMCIILHHTYV